VQSRIRRPPPSPSHQRGGSWSSTTKPQTPSNTTKAGDTSSSSTTKVPQLLQDVGAALTKGYDPTDSYEKHLPPPLPGQQKADTLLDRIAPIRTHERVLNDFGGSFFGLQVGVTVSQLDLVRKNTKGVEIVQVVNPDGSGNLETILARKEIGAKQRIELQGPALNTSLTPGELPVGARFIGVGLTSDVTSAMDHDALSYTFEVKLNEKSVAELAAFGGPGAAQIAADAIEASATSVLGDVVGTALVGAVPVLSAALALASARRAYHVVRDPTAGREMKIFQVAHAIGDAVRVVEPVTGTVINAALVAAAATLGWVHHRHTPHAPPTGPPPGTELPGSS
jgi:hypothetical protein